jgi:CDP-glycerol glycerophosphotransferase
VELEELERVLNDTSCKKFITIGRYSEEKGHSRLLDAFKEHVKENPTDYLIIIGGHGDKYAEIKERVLTEEGLEHVILIKASRNPAPILKKCDYFILSSFYEGLPMVIMEALILNKPVICTDITGPREFLQQGYGLLVEDSTQGLIDGMAQANKGLSLKPFDAEAFNKQALAELYNLIED